MAVSEQKKRPKRLKKHWNPSSGEHVENLKAIFGEAYRTEEKRLRAAATTDTELAMVPSKAKQVGLEAGRQYLAKIRAQNALLGSRSAAENRRLEARGLYLMRRVALDAQDAARLAEKRARPGWHQPKKSSEQDQ